MSATTTAANRACCTDSKCSFENCSGIGPLCGEHQLAKFNTAAKKCPEKDCPYVCFHKLQKNGKVVVLSACHNHHLQKKLKAKQSESKKEDVTALKEKLAATEKEVHAYTVLLNEGVLNKEKSEKPKTTKPKTPKAKTDKPKADKPKAEKAEKVDKPKVKTPKAEKVVKA